MSWGRRALATFDWRHLAVASLVGAAWPIVRRIGMVGNNVDAFALDFWLYEIVFSIVGAWICVVAIVLAETRTEAPQGPSNTEYVTALAAAAVVFAVVALWLLPPWPTGQPANPAGRRYVEMALRHGWDEHPVFILVNCVRAMMFASFAAALHVWLRRNRLEELALDAARMMRARAEGRLMEARLMSAHFTVEPEEVQRQLAAIEAACEAHPARAEAMMDELIAFLREAVPRLRETSEELHASQGCPG